MSRTLLVCRAGTVTPAPVISGTVTIGGSATLVSGTGPFTLYRDGVADGTEVNRSEAQLEAYVYVAADVGPPIQWLGAGGLSNALQYAFDQPAVPLLAHYDADLGVSTTAGEVTAWADQSGDSHDLAQSTSARRMLSPATGPNGHNALDARDVAGVGKSMSTTTFPTGATARTIFMVSDLGTKTDGYYYAQSLLGGVLYGYSSRVLFCGALGPTVVDPGGWNVDACVIDGANSKHAINGGVAATGNPGPQTMSQLTLNAYPGDPANTVYSGDGYIAKVLVYTGAMSDADRADVTAALMWWAGL